MEPQINKLNHCEISMQTINKRFDTIKELISCWDEVKTDSEQEELSNDIYAHKCILMSELNILSNNIGKVFF